MSQFITSGDDNLTAAGEDELLELAFDIMRNTDAELAPHLANASAFMKYFSRINEITVGGTTPLKNRTGGKLKEDRSHLTGGSRAAPSIYV